MQTGNGSHYFHVVSLVLCPARARLPARVGSGDETTNVEVKPATNTEMKMQLT